MRLFYTPRAAAASFAICTIGSEFYLDNIAADLYVGLMGSIYVGRLALGLDIENHEKGISTNKQERRHRLEETIQRKS